MGEDATQECREPLYCYYSQTAADQFGVIAYADADGQPMECTAVYSSEQAALDNYHWADKYLVGIGYHFIGQVRGGSRVMNHQLFEINAAGNLVRLDLSAEDMSAADRDSCMRLRDEIMPAAPMKFAPLPKRPLTEREEQYRNLTTWPELGSRSALVIGSNT